MGEEGELVSATTQLKLTTADGKRYSSECSLQEERSLTLRTQRTRRVGATLEKVSLRPLRSLREERSLTRRGVNDGD